MPGVLILDNVTVPLLIDGYSRKDAESKALKILDKLGRVDKVSDPEADGCEIDEAEIAFGSFAISGRQAA